MSVNSRKKAKNISAEKSAKYRVPNAVINYYLVLMFTVFPLFYTNSFTNIRHDKYYVFLGLSAAVIFVGFFTFLLNCFNKKEDKDLSSVRWYSCLSVTDYALGAFIIVCIISTVFSSYSLSCISGEQGRNVGLIFLVAAALVYAVISRLYIPRDYVFFFVSGGCLAVYLLGILNFFYIDPLSMFKSYDAEVVKDFTSTIGNKNIMSAFCCLTIPLFLTLYMNSKSRYLKYTALTAGGVGFCAMLCADSESGFLGFVPIAALILLYYSRNTAMIKRFFTALCAMLLCAKLLSVFAFFSNNNEKELGTMQRFFIHNNLSWILIVLFTLVALSMYYVERKKGIKKLPKAVPAALTAVYILAFLAFSGLFIYYSFIDTESKLGGVMTFFRFNEKWGTHRGYMWIKSLEIFKTGGIKNALIGSGPDSFFYAFMPYFEELSRRFGDATTNCAHNEFLNYLITTGFLGLSAYMTFVISAIIRAVKSAQKNYLAIVFAVPALCYLIQSVVNISNPIVTPFLFIYLGLSEAVVRSIKK